MPLFFEERSIAHWAKRNAVTDERSKAVENLERLVPGVNVEYNHLLGAPEIISARNGFLSGPLGQGRGIPFSAAARFKRDSNWVTKAFLEEHRALFGYGSDEIENARAKRTVVGRHNGMITTVWQQELDGNPARGTPAVDPHPSDRTGVSRALSPPFPRYFPLLAQSRSRP